MNKNALNIIITVILVIAVFGAGYWFNKKITFSPQVADENQKIENNQSNTNNNMLKIEILKQGAGVEAKKGDKVTVNYVGTLENGTKFDSSIDRGQPFSFTLGTNQVIQGWEQGILGMKVGEKRKLVIPSDLGYGEGGFPPIIPSNATLIFEVEMLKIN